MTTAQREGLRFVVDLTDPAAIHNFPASFAEFLVREDRDDLAGEFLDWLRRYVESTPSTEELSLWDICKGASQFAEIYDVSGVPFDQNEFLNPHKETLTDEAPQTAEQVLEELDRDTPTTIEPQFPEAVVVIQEGDDLPVVIFKAIMVLRKRRLLKASEALANDVRQALRSKPTRLDVFRIVEAYVSIKVEPILEREEELIGK